MKVKWKRERVEKNKQQPFAVSLKVDYNVVVIIYVYAFKIKDILCNNTKQILTKNTVALLITVTSIGLLHFILLLKTMVIVSHCLGK